VAIAGIPYESGTRQGTFCQEPSHETGQLLVQQRRTHALRQQRRRWLTIVFVTLTLLAVAVTLTLASLPRSSHHIIWGHPIAIKIPRIRGSDDEIWINAISCTSTASCSAGGFVSSSWTTDAVVVNESQGRWHRAHVVTDTGTTDVGANATINAISCASPGNCSAGGSFVNTEGISHSNLSNDVPSTAFVVNEVRGKWGRAKPLLGVVAPGNEVGATVTYLSCPTDGNCAAAGSFASIPCATGWNTCVLPGVTYKRQFEKSFVVNEVNGVWGPAQWLVEVNRGEYPGLGGLSCGAPGTCVAVGTSLSPSRLQEGFVVNETGGRWQSSARFPGLGLSGQTSSTLTAVSCGSRGNCSAGGSYTDAHGGTHPFLVDEVAGRWRRAVVVKGSMRPALEEYAQIQSVDCGSSNECTAFGNALGPASQGLYFVLTKRHGTWNSVRLVPGANPSTIDGFSGSEIACSSAQRCTIAGSYFTPNQSIRPYAISEYEGRFGHLKRLHGVARLNQVPATGSVEALSCGAGGNCVIIEEFAAVDYEGTFFVHETP
jgi:hypothetical protein